jgi:hypothetical protein
MCCLGQRFVICSFCFRAVKRQFTKEKNENLWQLKTIKLNNCFVLFFIVSQRYRFTYRYLVLLNSQFNAYNSFCKMTASTINTNDNIFLRALRTEYLILKMKSGLIMSSLVIVSFVLFYVSVIITSPHTFIIATWNIWNMYKITGMLFVLWFFTLLIISLFYPSLLVSRSIKFGTLITLFLEKTDFLNLFFLNRKNARK